MKPKYSLYKNFFYAIDGVKELSKEVSFRIEMFGFIAATVVLFILSCPLWAKLFMFASLFLPIFAEAFNTAIEKAVDMAMPEYHILAKHAKDIAAFGVLVSILMTSFIWLAFITYFFKG